MTEKELSSLPGKTVCVRCTSGQIVSGLCSFFTQALDNEPEVASIALVTGGGLVEITLPEIKSISE